MVETVFSATLNMSVPTLIAVLFWGNLISMLLVVLFELSMSTLRNRRVSVCFTLAKSFQAGAYFLLLTRGAFPDLLSVNVGNSFLFIGFFFESACLLTSMEEGSWLNIRPVALVTVAALLLFNLIEILAPDAALRVATASGCVFLQLLIPTLKMLFLKRPSAIKQAVAVIYLLLLLLQLPRAVYALSMDMDVFSNNIIQVVTFMSLLLLLLFGPMAYLVLIRENVDKQLHSMAMVDMLTGLVNRHSFLLHAQRVFDASRDKNSSLSLLFMDIDDFKRVNDTYGHAFGDTVLVRLAQLLKTSMRTVDIPSRFGGEEFVALLPRTSMKTARAVSRRIMEQVSQLRFDEHPEFSFSLSIGVASTPPYSDDSLMDCLKLADNAMYEAKRMGKNRMVVCAEQLREASGTQLDDASS